MTHHPEILRADPWAGRHLESRALLRQAQAGRLVRISHGRYVDAESWNAMDGLERHRLRTLAVASTAATDNVFSHHAAAALWRIPLLGDWPDRVDVTGPVRSGGRSSEQIRRHPSAAIPAEQIGTTDGVRLTSPARTVVDLARVLPFPEAVVAIDAACRIGRAAPKALLAEVRDLSCAARGRRGGRRAADAAAFATDQSESVWESVSRVTIRRLGFPDPVLQQEFRWDDRTSYRTDFWWPEYGVVGEFDGLVKYGSGEGDEARSALVREKIREDRLRTLSSGFVRWTASDVRDPLRLARLLGAAGLPRPTRRLAYANDFSG
ncbi:hypothetical protein ELQ92_05080 [Labedella populi]|uniref:AbiEi antitoxin C-terminal domain-containing protein n=1 Tax=Labedella populi TaxID=2498850 RepID=A0A3S3ZX56_9MICO|nr:type IV toxin-antitoxin system AbiEi family antitoxin [Labedella populi]RWZ68578.1 hypothetical protein ELQ92_05080 [Labedella populi]